MLDTALRRARLTYPADPLAMLPRGPGLIPIALLVLLLISGRRVVGARGRLGKSAMSHGTVVDWEGNEENYLSSLGIFLPSNAE
ncbi:MAG: hypothetical protein HY660_02790 [Armatimonadetes bacterium]|nr:hypothetical protein [Armatimonadota bacterium]